MYRGKLLRVLGLFIALLFLSLITGLINEALRPTETQKTINKNAKPMTEIPLGRIIKSNP